MEKIEFGIDEGWGGIENFRHNFFRNIQPDICYN